MTNEAFVCYWLPIVCKSCHGQVLRNKMELRNLISAILPPHFSTRCEGCPALKLHPIAIGFAPKNLRWINDTLDVSSIFVQRFITPGFVILNEPWACERWVKYLSLLFSGGRCLWRDEIGHADDTRCWPRLAQGIAILNSDNYRSPWEMFHFTASKRTYVFLGISVHSQHDKRNVCIRLTTSSWSSSPWVNQAAPEKAFGMTGFMGGMSMKNCN